MTQEKLEHLSIKPYDQVIALTQELINRDLETLFIKARTDPIPTYTLGDAFVEFSDFQLGKPKIAIANRAETPNLIFLRMRIQKGTYRYRQIPRIGIPFNEVPISGWYLAFPVELIVEKVPPEELNNLKTFLDIPAGCSVSRVVWRFAGGRGKNFDTGLSVTTLPPAELEQLAVQFNLNDSLNTKRFLDLEKPLLGHLMEDQSQKDPRFTPTSLTLQTYPWCDSTGKAIGIGTQGNSELNYLCYNGMTNNRPPPASVTYLPWTSNFTDGVNSGNGDQIPLGTFVISKDNFWTRWLLPQLSVCHKGVFCKVYDQHASCQSPNKYSWGAKKQILAYENDLPTEMWIGKEVEIKPGYPAWEWKADYDLGEVKDQAGAAIGIKGSISARNYSIVYFIPGMNRISVSGSVRIEEYCQVWRGIIDHAISDTDRYYRNVDWSFQLSLAALENGGLQVQLLPETVTSSYTKPAGKDNLHFIGCQFWDEHLPTILEDMLKSFEGSFSQGMQDVHKLYYPAGGMLYYKDPVFARNGDLHTTVEYNSGAIGEGKVINPDGKKERSPQDSIIRHPVQG